MNKTITIGMFAVLLTAPAFAGDTSTDNKPASSTSSGPGVKGAPGNKSGQVPSVSMELHCQQSPIAPAGRLSDSAGGTGRSPGRWRVGLQ